MIEFVKMQGAGNDYIYVDCFKQKLDCDLHELAIRISDRHFGVGGDGLVLIEPTEIADARMRMFNADGSESEMCGNAIRCVAKYLFDHGIRSKNSMHIETGAGVLRLEAFSENGQVNQVKVNMGQPIVEASQVPTTLAEQGSVVDQSFEIEGHTFLVTCISMGNPHCVVFVEKANDDLVLGLGPKIEVDPRFPNRINVEFVEVISRSEVRQRTWERGSGETWACGTGASAVCAAGVLSGRTDRKILNHLLGGDLTLEWDEASNDMYMTGAAVEVFSGRWD